jgi:hypothetical protein
LWRHKLRCRQRHPWRVVGGIVSGEVWRGVGQAEILELRAREKQLKGAAEGNATKVPDQL